MLTVKSTSESCTHKDFTISIFAASVGVAKVTCEERCHEQDFLFVLLTHLKKEEVANKYSSPLYTHTIFNPPNACCLSEFHTRGKQKGFGVFFSQHFF